MNLAAWLLPQIAINGGATYILRGGAEVPIDIEELAAEIDRRLDGLTFHPRLIVDSRSPVGALQGVRAEISLGLESLRQSTPAEGRMPVEISLEKWKKPGPGPQPKVLRRVTNEIINGRNAGKWTLAALRNWPQAALEAQFCCHHETVEKALALIAK